LSFGRQLGLGKGRRKGLLVVLKDREILRTVPTWGRDRVAVAPKRGGEIIARTRWVERFGEVRLGQWQGKNRSGGLASVLVSLDHPVEKGGEKGGKRTDLFVYNGKRKEGQKGSSVAVHQ